MSTEDLMVMPLAQELLVCLDQEIAKVLSPPTYVQLRTGDVVAHLMSMSQDECCEGLAWVRPVTFFPSSVAFPSQDEAPIPRGTASWGVTLEMGVIRCAPSTSVESLPTAEEWEAVTQAVLDDGAAMRRAICCFIEGEPGRAKIVIPGAWQPLAIEGGCVGGILPVTIRAKACDCTEAGPVSS
jgi:hypothetical protein